MARFTAAFYSHSVIFDATNPNEGVPTPLCASAAAVGVDPLIIRYTASEGLVWKRMVDRASGAADATQSDADWAVYTRMANGNPQVPRPHLRVSGPDDVERVLEETLRRMGLGCSQR